MAEKKGQDDEDDIELQEKIGQIRLKTQMKPDDKESLSKLLKVININPPTNIEAKSNPSKNRILASLMPPPPLPPPQMQQTSQLNPQTALPDGAKSTCDQLAQEFSRLKLENERLERLSDCLQIENEILQDLYHFSNFLKNPSSQANVTKIKNVRQGAYYVSRSLSKLHTTLSRERTLLCTQIAGSISKAVGFDAQSLARPVKDETAATDWHERKHSLMVYFNFDLTPEEQNQE